MTRPLYGIISVAMPFIGFLGAIGMETFTQWFIFSYTQESAPFFIFYISPMLGIAAGIAGLRRRERRRWLCIIGLILNALVLSGISIPTM